MEPTTGPLPIHHEKPVPHRTGEHTWEVDPGFRLDMRVPVRVFADPDLIEQIGRDRSLWQLVNVSTLPGIVDAALGMPDVHEGYGFPVGGVAGTLLPDGVISPGGIGFDINCGVRLLVSDFDLDEIRPVVEPLLHEISRTVPAGFGRSRRKFSLERRQLDSLLEHGVPWMVEEMGLGLPEDLHFLESGGALPGAHADRVSERAKERGHVQVGTLGGGNHFLEIQVVDAIYDQRAAAELGLREGGITVMIHTGSRGFGHQVCTDYVKRMDSAMMQFGIHVPDRQLACAPFSSKPGQDYFSAMAAAANFGYGNRQMIMHMVRGIFARQFGESKGHLRLVYDVGHNTAKVERHDDQELVIHRKGATRAFGPSSPELPPAYRGLGQPIFIPGSMGTHSYVLLGTDEAREISLASTCHGAGRAMSRTASKHQVHGAELRRQLVASGIAVRCPSNAELAEEAPTAYKDVDKVVEVVHQAGIARKVARVRPIGVLKG